MSQLAPEGPIYQAGTLSGNPLAMAAGRATLETLLSDHLAFRELEEKADALAQGIEQAANRWSIPITTNRVGSMMTLFFTSGPVRNFEEAKKSDTNLYGKFFHALVAEGVYIAPSAYEAMFVSTAHTSEDICNAIRAIESAMKKISSEVR